jgi:integral membrane sensor domain MASE1
MPDMTKRRCFLYALFAAAYLALDQASYILPSPEFNVTPWNPHPALAVALLMLCGRQAIGVVYLAILAAELLFRLDVTTPASAALVAAVMTLGYSAMAGALRGRWRIAPSLRHRGDMVRMLAVVTIGSLATGLAYVGACLLTRWPAPGALSACLRFWIGDGVGMVVTLPFVLMLSDGFRRAQIAALVRRGEFLFQCAILVASLPLVFFLRESLQAEFFYLLFLPLIWISVRHGLAGTVPVMVIVQVGVVPESSVREQARRRCWNSRRCCSPWPSPAFSSPWPSMNCRRFRKACGARSNSPPRAKWRRPSRTNSTSL